MPENLPDQPGSPSLIAPDGEPLYPTESPADREIATWQAESPYFVPFSGSGRKHIVDELILERARKLSQSRFWPLYRRALYALLNYRKAKATVDTAGRWNAEDTFAYCSEILDMKLDIKGLEHLPKSGPVIIVPNHPTGIADGLAIHDTIRKVRRDVKIFINGDALRLNPRMQERLIPVEWHEKKKSRAKSRETLKDSSKAFREGAAIVLFPAGRIALIDEKKEMHERRWESSVGALAKKNQCPIVPVHIASRNSWLYYWFWKINEELRDMTLFHELFNKKGKTLRITIEKPIEPGDLKEDNDEAAAELRAYVMDGIPKSQTFGQWRAAGGNKDSVAPPPL